MSPLPDRTIVAGAAGRIGGATLQALTDAGERPLALVRSAKRGAGLSVPCEFRVADLTDREAFATALDGVGSLLLCTGHAPDMCEIQVRAIETAAEAGVRRVVKISASPASIFEGTPSRIAAQHLEIEQALAASGLEYTNIRPNAFTQVLCDRAGDIARGDLPLLIGNASVSWVDANDVGALAAAALRAEGPLPPSIDATGPAALDGPELAALISAQVGHPVAYRPLTDEEAMERLWSVGTPAWLVEHVVTIHYLLRERGGDRVLPGIAEWTGTESNDVGSVLAREAAVFAVPQSPIG